MHSVDRLYIKLMLTNKVEPEYPQPCKLSGSKGLEHNRPSIELRLAPDHSLRILRFLKPTSCRTRRARNMCENRLGSLVGAAGECLNARASWLRSSPNVHRPLSPGSQYTAALMRLALPDHTHKTHCNTSFRSSQVALSKTAIRPGQWPVEEEDKLLSLKKGGLT